MPDVQKISIALTAEHVNALKAAVETGEYATASEVVREALREWQWKRQMRGENLNRLREPLHEGKASGKASLLDLPQARQRAREKLKKAAERVA